MYGWMDGGAGVYAGALRKEWSVALYLPVRWKQAVLHHFLM